MKTLNTSGMKHESTVRRVIQTWLLTLAGVGAMAGITLIPFLVFHAPVSVLYGWGIVWTLLPLVSWWFSAEISLKIAQAQPVDLSNPTHARLARLVEEVWQVSGLKHKPPVYIAASTAPNAFATGPIHRKAVVAATQGLFDLNLTDGQIKGVFAHELSHVKNYDVAINSFVAVLSSIFFLASNSVVNAWIKTIKLFRRTLGLAEEPKTQPHFGIGSILGSVVMYAIFWATSQLTRIVQMFVVRSRESGADATGALMTGEPCDLAAALQKLAEWSQKNRPKGVQKEFFRAIRPMMTIDPLFDSPRSDEPARGLWQRIKAAWQYLQLTHPPVPQRIAQLEKMNGGSCNLG
jgi:heat shock protein HtpX